MANRQYSPEERSNILRELKSSGMTQRAFTAQHGVSYHTLQYWLHGKSKKKRQAGEARFVDVTPVTPMASVRLVIGEHVALELPELPAPTYLAELARAAR